MINNRKIRLAFIGCGRIMQKHLDALKHYQNDIEIIAVCDVDSNKVLSFFGEKSYVKIYSDIDKMLTDEKLDIVSIITPNGLHCEHVIKVASYGIHAITEKPMAISLQEAQYMTQYCNEQNVKLFVLYQNRFNETISTLRKAYEEGRFGKIHMINSNVYWYRENTYYTTGNYTWHGSKNLDGGTFYTQASHYIDIIQWFANARPKTIYANLKTLGRDIETEDTGIANIEWENNILSSINVTTLAYPKNFEGSLTIIGEKGTVKLGDIAMNNIEYWSFADDKDYDQNIKEKKYSECVYGIGHIAYYQNIIHTLHGTQQALVDGKEGLKSIEILNAIHESNNTSSIIRF